MFGYLKFYCRHHQPILNVDCEHTASREQSKVDHAIIEMSRERIYTICGGYEDANDLDTLRRDPALKLACKRLPASRQRFQSM